MSEQGKAIQRTAVNPWPWSLQFSFSQGQLLERPDRVLVCSGQISVDAEGSPQHVDDMASQIRLALDNLQAVLAGGGMTLADLVQITIYTTDVDELLQNYGALAERLGAAGVTPASTLLGVGRLAFPELLVEIQATAAQ